MRKVFPTIVSKSINPPYAKISALLALLILLIFPEYSLAAVIHVPADYSTIQAAIDVAVDGDEIIVSQGTYYENINFDGKNIVLHSNDPTSPTVVTNTIIDGRSTDTVVTFSGTELTTCVLSGFTIANGYALSGGGIYGNGTWATIQYNIVTTNTANGIWPDGGGGLAYCDGTIQNNTVTGNSAYHLGGGMYNCHGTIQNNTVSGNSADLGAGLYLCNGIIQNNTITNNSASSRAGGLEECHGFIINCIIWSNSARHDTQLYKCSTPFFSCIQDWTDGGRGNISDDPRFADPVNGDYHLQHGSPCIDTGNIFYLFGEYLIDIDGECRLIDSSVDMGSDEYGSSQDSDGDLLADIDEATQATDAHNSDTDGDGLIDGVEVLRGTDPNVYNTPSGISIPGQWPLIQQGLFFAFPLEIITVSPNTYYENLHFMGKNLILQSTNPVDDDIVSSTTIDGDLLFSVVSFKGNENKTCVLSGFTIANGYGINGGGICGNGALAAIQYNSITTNTAYFSLSPSGLGGGLYRCDGTIQNNTISGNWAWKGAGLYGCMGTIQDNIISDNWAYYYGGGLYGCEGTIQNNVISDNYGRGVDNCNGTIEHNTISSNYGGGLRQCGGNIKSNIISGNSAGYGGALDDCDGTIQNNVISGNSAGHGGG